MVGFIVYATGVATGQSAGSAAPITSRRAAAVALPLSSSRGQGQTQKLAYVVVLGNSQARAAVADVVLVYGRALPQSVGMALVIAVLQGFKGSVGISDRASGAASASERYSGAVVGSDRLLGALSIDDRGPVADGADRGAGGLRISDT